MRKFIAHRIGHLLDFRDKEVPLSIPRPNGGLNKPDIATEVSRAINRYWSLFDPEVDEIKKKYNDAWNSDDPDAWTNAVKYEKDVRERIRNQMFEAADVTKLYIEKIFL